jgi:hypothetical protein
MFENRKENVIEKRHLLNLVGKYCKKIHWKKLKCSTRPIALTSQILRVSSRCSLTISVRVQQPHTAQKLTILIQNYYKLLQNFLCLQKLYCA